MVEIKCTQENFKLVPIEKIVPNPKNNNRHSVEQIKTLEKLIKAHGFRSPLVISNRTGFLVSGHGRLDAAMALGMNELPVIYQDFASEAEEYQHMTADNEIARWAELDFQGVYDALKEIPDIDTSLLGIEDFKLPEVIEPQADEDDVPESRPEPKVVRGEVYILGNHRLMCGDSTAITDVERLMNGEKADMVFTDPPYGAGFDIKNDRADEFLNVFIESMNNASTICNSTFLICSYYSCISEFVSHMRTLGFVFNEKIVWVKNLFGQGKVFHRKHEDILFFSKGNHIKDQRNKFDDVMNFDSVRNFMGSKNAHEAVGHPTQKPVELLIEVMKPLSINGFIIYDSFGGSGSTLIACEKTNRKCFMMELDPFYCGVILDRWQKFTGKKAHREDGKLWDELKEQVQ